MLTCALLFACLPQTLSPSPAKAGGPSKVVLDCGYWEPSFQHNLTGFPPILPKFNAAHMALIPKGPNRGKVMAWDILADPTLPEWKQRWSIVDPLAPGGPTFLNSELVMPAGEGDLFCAGLAWTSAGDLLVVGGTMSYPALTAGPSKVPKLKRSNSIPPPPTTCPTCGTTTCGPRNGSTIALDGPCGDACGCGCYGAAGTGYVGGKLTYLWSPDNGVWYRQPDLAITRWYPTAMLRADGSLLVAGGVTTTGSPISEGNNYEVFVPSAGNPPAGTWQQGPGGQVFPGPINPTSSLYIYPRLYNLTNGLAFMAGMSSHSVYLDHTHAPGVWTKGKTSQIFDARVYSTSVLMPYVPDASGNYVDEVMTLGGNGMISRRAWRLDGTTTSRGFPSVNTVEICHPTAADKSWIPAAPMNHKRKFANGVLLADGSLMVMGGTAGKNDQFSVYTAELYDGTSWTELPAQDTKRTYHSTALLLPDGRVLSAGGNTATRAYQVFVPSYLCGGNPRPAITGAPATMGYFSESPIVHTIGFDPLPVGHSVERAVLISPGAVTHHTDYSQRYVQLITESVSSDHIDVRAPATRNLVPPGYYMLFLLSDAGVPSVASWVKVQ